MVPGILPWESENPQQVPRRLSPGLPCYVMDEPEAHSRAYGWTEPAGDATRSCSRREVTAKSH